MGVENLIKLFLSLQPVSVVSLFHAVHCIALFFLFNIESLDLSDFDIYLNMNERVKLSGKGCLLSVERNEN